MAHSGAAELGPYRHYMQKEIFEQPRAIADTLDAVRGHHARAVRRRRAPRVQGRRLGADPRLRHQLLRGSVAKYWLEAIAQDPDRGRDRERVPLPRQRAEPEARWSSRSRRAARPPTRWRRSSTRARSAWTHTLTICNVATSAMVRECEMRLRHARRRRDRRRIDQGVHDRSSSALFLLALALAQVRGRLDRRARRRAPEGAAPPAGRRCRRARARAADHRLERGASRARRTRCSSAAACTTRSRSKAR